MALTIESLKPKRSNKPPRIVFYAVPKFGKTTFASQAPNPVFIQAEEGEGELELAGKKVNTYDEIIEFIAFLAENEHDFRTVVLDTADAVEKILWSEVVKREGKNSIEEIGWGKGYVKANELWAEILKGFDYLRDQKGMAIIVLAHTKIKRHTPPDCDSYDRYTFALQDSDKTSTCVLLSGWADVILFGNYKVFTKKSESDGSTKGLNAEAPRSIYTEERATHWGGNRYGLPYEIPFEKGSQWSAFSYYLNKEDKKAAKKQEPELLEAGNKF
jgi:hypothetical protein